VDKSAESERVVPATPWRPDQILGMLAPTAVTIVGGSPRIGATRHLLLNLRNQYRPFAGPVRIVNPGAAPTEGVETYASVDQIEGDLGTVVVMMRAERTVDWLESLPADRTLAGVIVYAGGFAEIGNLRDTERMQRWATARQVPVIGPQSLGFLNAHGSACVELGRVPEPIVPGPISVLCQSGGLMGGSSRALLQRGLGVGTAVSYGNASVVGFADLAHALLHDEATRVILIHTEQLGDLTLLRQLGAAAHEAGKAVVLTLAGASEAGRRAVVSHTAAVSTPRNLARNVCEQAGIIWMNSVDDMLDAADALVSTGVPSIAKSGVGIFAGSGGGAIAIADALEEAGVPLVPPAPETIAAMRALGVSGEVSNPCDGGAGLLDRPEDYDRQVEAFASDPGYGIVCKVIGSSAPTPLMPAQLGQYQQFADMVPPLGKTAFLATPINQDVPDLVRWDGVAWGAGASRVAAKLRALNLWATYREDFHAAAPGPIESAPPPSGVTDGELVVLTGPAAAEKVGGLPVAWPSTYVVRSPEDASACVAAVEGEVVVKSECGLNHRAAVGAVIGPVAGPTAVGAALALIGARWGYPISVTAAVPHDTEWMVGVEYLEQYGWVISAGRGGVGAGAELRLYSGPLDRAGADLLVRRALGERRDDVVELLLALQRVGLAMPGFRSLELNPVVLSDDGELCALDIKVSFIDQSGSR